MGQAAAIYCRISDDRDGSAAGVRRQEEDCRALADRRGWQVAKLYVDNDVSAYSGKRRPQYRAMLEAIKGGEIDAVVVWHLDRLHRRPMELEEFFEICDAAGVRDLASVTGDVDLSTHDGRFMARILGAVARKESDDKSRRTIRKHQELAEQGKAVGGGRPFGYEADRITIRLDEAELVREASRRVLAGESLRAICVDWQRRGVRAVRGGRWITQTALRRVLLSGRIAGLRTHEGRGTGRRTLRTPPPVVAKAEWPAIVDEATWQRVRAVLADPARQTYRGFGARTYLLPGFLWCGKCARRLISRGHEKRRRTYVCASGPGTGGCGGLRIVAQPLEELVAAMVLRRLGSAEFVEQLAAQRRPAVDDGLIEAIAEDDAALAQAAKDHYVDRVTTRAEFLAVRGALEARLEANRRRLARQQQVTLLDGLVGEPEALQAAWEAHHDDLAWRRAVLATVLEGITVGPAERGLGRFDERRILPELGGRVDWRL